jgi:uncharacterized protein (UPF0335 family)
MTKRKNSDRLLGLLERIERLEDEKAQLAADIGMVKKEAKGLGFDIKVVNQMLRERRMEPEERADYQSLCELYRAALGMLDGTPLGDAARKRLLPPDPDADEPPGDPFGSGEAPPSDTAAPPPSADDVKSARAEGGEAARKGRPVTGNPYSYGDARRSAWDEGWCATAGSDGMEVPDAWRRRKPAKPTDATPPADPPQ